MTFLCVQDTPCLVEGVSVSDPDTNESVPSPLTLTPVVLPGSAVEARLSVERGRVSLGSREDVALLYGGGVWDAQVVIRVRLLVVFSILSDTLVAQGSLEAVNRALTGLTYLCASTPPSSDQHIGAMGLGGACVAGTDHIVVWVNDLGGTGEGGALSKESVLEIVVHV